MAEDTSSQVNNDISFEKQDNDSTSHLSIETNFVQEITLPASSPSSQQSYFTPDVNNVVALMNDGHEVVLGSLHQTQDHLVSLQHQDISIDNNEESQLKNEENLQTVDSIILQSPVGVISQNASEQIEPSPLSAVSDADISSSMVQFGDMASMVLASIQPVMTCLPNVTVSVPNVSVPGNISTPLQVGVKNNAKYFCLSTLEEVEEAIRKHTEETFSHFVVAKKTKAYGTPVNVIDVSTKFRIHWQSRDLTTTEECAVQIPFEGVPFIYIGEKAYMCHLGRSKASKNKVLSPEDMQPKKHRSRITKKQGCPAKIFVKQIAKFPQFRIPNNSEYLRTQMSQKLRKALVASEGLLEHTIQYVGTLPDISDHFNHDIGENTPVREPIDPIIRDKIVELSWEYGDNALPRQVKEHLDHYVENVLFKGKTPPSKNRRRFYPSEKDIANYIYKSRLISKLSCNEQDQLHMLAQQLQQSHPDEKLSLCIESEDQQLNDATTSLTITTETKIIFSYQTHDQQRLLKRYGKQAILTEVSKHATNLPFPFFGVFVPTNVDYQLVYSFIIQTRSNRSLRDGLADLVEWNPYWSPKFFVVDFSLDQINAIESILPCKGPSTEKSTETTILHWIGFFVPNQPIHGKLVEITPFCGVTFLFVLVKFSVLISEESRKYCWKTWLDNPVNSASLVGNKDDVYERLSSIANSYTEETLNNAAQNLENSEVWRLSEGLRDWFSSEWLAEAKRWVVGYRHDEYFSTLHFDVLLCDEVTILRDSHYGHLKTKKLSDFIKHLVEDLVPTCYQRYVSRNILDYRKQYLSSKKLNEYPSYLQNKPSSVANYLLEQIKLANAAKYTVSQMQPGIFWIQDKNDADVTYAMSFGDAAALPSCVCIDWLKYRLPCKHLVTVFQSFRGWGWDMLSTAYTGNPVLNLDFSCFDKNQEDIYLINLKDDGCTQTELHIPQLPAPSTQNALTIVKPLMNTNMVPFVTAVNNPIPNNLVTSVVNHTPSNTTEIYTTTGTPETFHFVANLATDCDSFCQELSNTIHQVDNRNILQKVKLDLQLMLNDVKLEISKVPSSRPSKRVATNSSTDQAKKLKLISNINALTELQVATSSGSANLMSPSSNNGIASSAKSELAISLTSTPVGHHLGYEITTDQGAWIFDAELDIKLSKFDQKSIFNGKPLSLDIVKSVQNVLRHQFDDVSGLCDPDKLAELSDSIKNQVGNDNKNKVLQLHIADNEHWSASAKIAENIYIFCCTLSSKAKVIEQILHMTSENCMGDNILFIERMEKDEHISNCGLHAIAYTVAFAFDIEPRNLIFNENEMRSHLAECLEDMCFSMFPLKTL